VSFPAPRPGLVIRYSYLWADEAASGRDEGIKDRPCAVVLVVFDEHGRQRVQVLPVTHRAPTDPRDGLEIPQPVKARLGLDGERSWIVLTEMNDFTWPGPTRVPGHTGCSERSTRSCISCRALHCGRCCSGLSEGAELPDPRGTLRRPTAECAVAARPVTPRPKGGVSMRLPISKVERGRGLA
jgi:hypothetical protein